MVHFLSISQFIITGVLCTLTVLALKTKFKQLRQIF